MEDFYALAGYGSRDVGFGERSAVLIVDLQNAVTHSDALMGRSPLVASVGLQGSKSTQNHRRVCGIWEQKVVFFGNAL